MPPASSAYTAVIFDPGVKDNFRYPSWNFQYRHWNGVFTFPQLCGRFHLSDYNQFLLYSVSQPINQADPTAVLETVLQIVVNEDPIVPNNQYVIDQTGTYFFLSKSNLS